MTFCLRRHWWLEIAAGRKTVEYRAIVPFWTSRLKNLKPGDRIFFRRGRFDGFSDIHAILDRIDIGPCPHPGWPSEVYRIHFHLEKTPYKWRLF